MSYYGKIKAFIIKIFLKCKNKSIIIEDNATVDRSCFFEGYNRICRNTKLQKCYVGYASYVGENSILKNSYIGKYTSIGPNVRTIIGMHPTNTFVSTHPSFYSTRKQVGFSYVTENKYEEFKYSNVDNNYFVYIGNDVWIGDGAMLVNGVSIGDGAVIASGALVNKDVEPYSIVGGVPSKIIRYRFNDEQIKFLQNLRWWDKNQNWIEKHAVYFDNIDKLMKLVK